MMFNKPFFIILFSIVSIAAIAQPNAISHEAELGVSVGNGHYFGDMNRSRVNRPKVAAGLFFRKQFGSYVALRASGHYSKLGYADKYNTTPFERQRNLSFNTDIWEFAIQGDFNFFKFLPGSKDYRFTPYVTFGVGTFSFDPYAFIPGDSDPYDLNIRTTEGQERPYSQRAISFPIGMGVKYNFSKNLNIGFEVAYRFTNTDYLDDVSTTYAGSDKFIPGTPAYFLQDRSLTLPQLGIAGKQRGFSEQKDQFVFAELTLSISFNSYKCVDIR
jgi:opacity protein-like surface antigen